MNAMKFGLKPFENRWFHWDEIAKCFWPGQGERSEFINSSLAPARKMAGIYVICWSKEPPTLVAPSSPRVMYIGQFKNFKKRLEQFGWSAGLWDEDRYNDHSAAWRWPQGESKWLWVAFYPLANSYPEHIKVGLLYWQDLLH